MGAPITEQFIADAFERDIRPLVFADSRPPEGQPLLVLLGGQPGAGKTVAERAIRHERAGAHLTSVIGDEFRRCHPEFARLAIEEPLEMPARTSEVSGPLVRACLDYALEHRYSVMLEGTFRSPELTATTVREFAGAGYQVEAVVMAVRPELCYLSAEHRYLEAREPINARWTPPEAHRLAEQGMPRTVEALEAMPEVSRVEVHNRDGLIYASDSGSVTGARAAIEREWSRPMRPDERASWLTSYQEVRARAVERPGYLSGPSGALWGKLDRSAREMQRRPTQVSSAPVSRVSEVARRLRADRSTSPTSPDERHRPRAPRRDDGLGMNP